jgi:hypothetical protein
MDRQMMKTDLFGRIEIVGETTIYTAFNWMDSWSSLSFTSKPEGNYNFVIEEKWDDAIERILNERIDAWKILAKL